jgi:hypothetical protein
MLFGLPRSDIQLINWNIICLNLPSGESGEFFIGYSLNDRLGRFSTSIVIFDEELRVGTTQSGSNYKLLGEPGKPCDDGMYVLCQLFGKAHIHKELFSDKSKGIIRFKYSFSE